MADNCKIIKINVKGLETLQNHCNNYAQFIKYINFISESYASDNIVPKEEFANWYKKEYNKELDFNKKENAKEIEEAIKEYYKLQSLSVTGSKNIQSKIHSSTTFIYSSPEARSEVMLYIADCFTNFNRILFIDNAKKDPNKYIRTYLDNKKYLAKDVISNSNLSDNIKNELKEDLRLCYTLSDIRNVLNKYNLKLPSNPNLRSKTYFKGILLQQLKTAICKKIAVYNNTSYDTVKKDFDTLNYLDVINKLGKDSITAVDKNYISMYFEIKSDENNKFIDEIISNRYTNTVEFFDKKSLDEKEENKRVSEEEAQTESGNVASDVDDSFISIIAAYDHTGLTTDALSTIDHTVKAHLGSIRKLNSTRTINGEPDYDRNNALGVPQAIDIHKAYGYLYHQVSYANEESMIRDIRRIADTHPDMVAFHTLANELEADEDLSNLYWNTFAKLVIFKSITKTSPNGNEWYISNMRCDIRTTLRNKFLNSVKFSAYSIANGDEYLTKVKGVIESVEEKSDKKRINGNEQVRAELINKIAKLVKYYFPCIDEKSIKAYIELNKNNKGSVDYALNIKTIAQSLEKTITAANETYNNHAKGIVKLNNIHSFNKTLDSLIDDLYNVRKKDNITREQIVEHLSKLTESEAKAYVDEYIKGSRRELYNLYSYKYIDESAFVEEDYSTTELKKEAIVFADMLLKYSPVNADLNSVNAERNQVSSVINSSYLTNMINILRDEVILEKFGEHRSLSSQYNLSHLLFEHKTENPEETTYGLFRKNLDGSITITEYATELLKISLFDGAVDETTGKAALYFKMTKGDYLGTAFVNFFNSFRATGEYSYDEINKIKRAGYFMRIPADAKNNFVVQAPRYSVEGLYTVTNENDINTIIDDHINNIKKVSEEDKKTIINDNPIEINNKEIFIDFITNVKDNKGKNIRLPKLGKYKEQEITIELQYKEENFNGNRFIVKGTVNKQGTELENAKLVGLSSGLDKEINDSLRDILRNSLDKQGKIKREYNVNHPLFASLKRAFRQELIDMAVAIDSIFETHVGENQGLIKRYSEQDEKEGRGKEGELIFKPNKSNIGNDNVGCYSNYHYNDGVIVKKENGRYELTGNVFKSNKFTIIDTKTGKVTNLGNELIEKLLNPLYGGSDNTFIKTIKIDDKIVDVDINSIDSDINSMISNFINKLVQNTIERLDIYSENIKDINVDFNNVAEFIINYDLIQNAFDDLFEGNSKIYKSGQDAFKRTKEVQGSGNPYGLPDFNTLFGRKYSEISSILDTDPFKNLGIRQHNQYRAVTIRNTKMTGPTIGVFNVNDEGKATSFKEIGTLSKQLIEEFKKYQGLTEKEATDKAFEIMSRYYNPKVNDAQSYITFDEWVRRIARRGQLFKYKPLIDKIINNEPLLADELEEFVQVQKNFQYDIAWDEDAQGFFPRQIKNAEFVLIPQLIKGTELETVAKLMEKYHIDQLNTEETSKAGKTNILEVFDKNTGLVKEDIIEEIEKGGNISKFGDAINNKKAIQFYNYEYLFTQQETHQHVQADNKAGVQIMKKMLDNIDENNKDLYPIKQKFIELYTKNITASAEKYYSQFGLDINSLSIKTDENGKLSFEGLNLEKFYDIYKRELSSRKDDVNLLDFATLEDTGINGIKITKLPDFLTLTSRTLEQIAQSMVNNNIVRQMLPGFHGPQVTSVGFNDKSINELGGGNVKRKYSDKLKFYPDGKQYIEVMVSPSFFGLERKRKDGKLKSKEELLDELKESTGNSKWGADTFIGYRIPTEAKYSVAVMKVVDFVDDAYGSTIVVPNDWVAQTGSDFDVDSIYGITAHTKINKEGKIEKINDDEDTKQSRDNGILNCMLEIMQHHSTLEERLLTSNTDHINDAIKNVIDKSVKTAKNNRSQYNFLDQVENHDDAISGMELKAISVAWDGLISIANSVGMYLPKGRHIIVNGHDLKQFGDDSEHNHRNYSGHLLTAYSAETSPYEFDAIKSGAIPNINKFSFGVFKFLSGMGVDYDTNLNFMTTPGITRLVKLNDKYNSIYSSYSPNIINKAIEEIAKELNIDTRNRDTDSILGAIKEQYKIELNLYDSNANIYITTENINNSKNPKATNTLTKEQISLISEVQDILTFKQIQNLADKFTALSMVLRGDKISAKKSIYETEDILEKAEELAQDDTITTKDSINIIDAIFPGLIKQETIADNTIKVLDVKNFMNTDRTEESKYKVLYTFMRYATIPSIIINKQLFSTQNEAFKLLEKQVRSFNKDGRSLSPKAKETLTKYAISQIYYNVFLGTVYGNKEIPEGFTINDELKRIKGYKFTSDSLHINDLNNPKDYEIEEFKQLSPGEQILFLRNNLVGENIFNIVDVNINAYGNKGHRITFDSVNNNLELARRLFSEAFFDDNPLINIAAHNMLKYAFIDEGYSMRKDGISQIVSGTKNICLEEYKDNLRREFNRLYEGSEGNENVSSFNLALDFVRSNTEVLSIPSHFVEYNDNNVPELIKVGSIIAVPETSNGVEIETNKKIIEKYDIRDNGIVKLKFKTDKKEDDYTLYRCIKVVNQNSSTYVLYPLNKLEYFEHGEISSNKDNKKHPTSTYFKNLISVISSTENYLNIETIKQAFTKVAPETDTATPVREIHSVNNIPFDINNPSDDLNQTADVIKDKIEKTFSGEVTPSTKTCGIFPILDKYIKKTGIWNGEPQTVTVNKGTDQERNVTVSIWRHPYDNKIKKAIEKGEPIIDNSVPYKDIVNTILHDYPMIKYLNENIYMITPPLTLNQSDMEGLKASFIKETSIENVAYESYETINTIARTGNTGAERIISFWEDSGIEYNDESIFSNIDIILPKSAPMFREYVSYINNKINNFYKDEDTGEYLSINDKRLAPILATNKEKEHEFLQLLNVIESIIKSNPSILALNIDAHDDSMKHNLTVMRSSITKLKDNSKVIEANIMYAKEVIGARSTNPLLKKSSEISSIIDIFSPHYYTNHLNGTFMDMLETSNPFAQNLLKKVTDDIYAKDLQAKRNRKEFLKKVEDIKNKARKAGVNVDINKFINDNGVVIQKFNEDLINDLQEHRDKIKENKQKYEQATNFVDKHNYYKEYLKSKLDFDKFLIDHIEQKVVKDYYIDRYNLEYSMLYGTMTEKEAKASGGFFGNPEALEHSDILVQYKILRDKQFELYNIKRKGLLDDTQQKELESIEKELSELMISPTDSELREDVVEPDKPLTEEEKIKAKIRNIFSRQAIINYVNTYNSINEKYFEYDPEFGFNEELERNLKIIENRELRDSNGNLTKPMSELMEDPEYVKAKLWLKQYTLFVADEETEQRKNKAFGVLRSKDGKTTLKGLIRDKKARDDKGTVDARVFNEDEIKKIKEEQLHDQIYNEGSPVSDRILISFAKRNNIVYNDDFYLGMMSSKDKKHVDEWINTAKEINEILIPFYNETVGGINWREMGNTEESRQNLIRLGDLYRKLENLSKTENAANQEKVNDFFKNNVDSTLSQEETAEFLDQQTIAKSLGEDFYKAWKHANVLENDKINKYLYHSLRPKASVAEKFILKEKTEAIKTLNELYTEDYTEYYYAKYREMKEKGREAFNEWYKNNHIYNFRTKRYEPIRCWIQYQYRDNIKEKLKYIPKRSKTTKEPKKEYINENYTKNLNYAFNYIEGTGYDNKELQKLNEYEIELKNLINTVLSSLVVNKKDLNYFAEGYLPYQRKQEKADAKFIGKEFLSAIGWNTNNNGIDSFDKIDYAKNMHTKTPMLELLDQVTPKEDNIIKPEKNENETDEDFNKRMKDYENQLKEHKEKNRKRHEKAINKEWIDVIAEFITEAGHHNAIQDNYEILHYGKTILDDYKVYVRKYGFFGDYKYDKRSYIMERDENIAKQYENYIRRLLLNQWKESNEKVTRWAARLQSLTSAQYMMMNIRGGIANVTLGKTQIAAEAVAEEIIDEKSLLKAEALYMKAIPSFALHMFDDKASDLVDAIIKTACVVDYDEQIGRARIVENPTTKTFNFFNKAAYSPQAIGEHYMQNSVLIAALLSHHVYTETDPITGETIVTFKNRGEVIQDCDKDALLSMLTEEEKKSFNELINNIKKDPNKEKDFAWFKEDIIHFYVKNVLKDKQKQKEYIKLREDLKKKRLKEFDDKELHPDVFSQLALSDEGYMEVKIGSILSKYDIIKEDGSPSDAINAFAALRNRVISVNKKIHGVYNKLGQAQIEKKWYGGLLMQYHKHIPLGISKRYRKEGYYNEMRGTVEKGSYVSLVNFLATPFRKNKYDLQLTDNEVNTLEGIKNTFKSIIDFTTHIGLNWNMLPDYEKANIRRNWGDIIGVLSSMLLAIVLKGFVGDDDDEDSIMYNLALYETDRLGSEAGQFTPLGAINEFKKLWSAPIAAQSGVSDLLQSMDIIAGYIWGGDDFDPYFRTGRFAGQHKLKVYVERRIPLWRGIKTSFLDITEQNNYYKLKKNIGGAVVDNILEWIDDDYDDED